jgi:ornithine carbamoyltransferase
VINTDVWASMGQEGEAAARQEAFWPYQVNAELLQAAAPEAMVLHCLPAHRGEEITARFWRDPKARSGTRRKTGCTSRKALLEWLLG